MWGYTPRQAATFLFLANLRRRRNASDQLVLDNVATHASGKEVRKAAKKLERV